MNMRSLLINNYNMANRINALSAAIGKNNEALSTGKRINCAADSPGDMLRISRFNSQICGSQVAQRNIQDGISMLQVMDDAASSSKSIGQRLRELAVSYNDDTLSNDDKKTIQDEAASLIGEMSNLFKNAKFNGNDVFSRDQYVIQTGANAGDTYTIKNSIPKQIIDINSMLNSAANNNTGGTNSSVNNSSSTTPSSGSNSTYTCKQYSICNPEYDKTPFQSYKNYSGYAQVKDSSGSVVYDGNLTNGTIDGYGTLYKNGKVLYSGTWNNGTINGYGNLYNDQGQLQYQGTTINGVIDGYGQYSENGKLVYQGCLRQGYRQGWGSTYNTSGNVIESRYYQDYDLSQGTTNNQNSNTTINNTSNTDTTSQQSNGGSAANNLNFSWLNVKFIDDNILDPLANASSKIGMDINILSDRYSYQQQNEVTQTSALSKIQDADMAKEMIEKAKNEILQSTNVSLFSGTLDDDRSYILQLLK